MNEEPKAQVEAQIVPMDMSHELRMIRQPEQVLSEATRAAKALQNVLEQRPKKDIVIFGGRRHLRVEDWQTCAKFYGLVARTRDSQRIEIGPATGWHAYADVVDRDGNVVSSGEAICMSDEDNWSTRPKYEYEMALKSGGHAPEDKSDRADWVWEDNPNKKGGKRPKRVKIQVGTEPVPEFQRLSMAQTRAMAKALKNCVAWVVVLAGFEPVAAEEMSGTADDDEGASKHDVEPMQMPQEKPKPPTTAAAPSSPPAAKAPGGGTANDKQKNYIKKLAKEIGLEEDAQRHAITAQLCNGKTSTNDLSIGEASTLIDALLAVKNGKTELIFKPDGTPVIELEGGKK